MCDCAYFSAACGGVRGGGRGEEVGGEEVEGYDGADVDWECGEGVDGDGGGVAEEGCGGGVGVGGGGVGDGGVGGEEGESGEEGEEGVWGEGEGALVRCYEGLGLGRCVKPWDMRGFTDAFFSSAGMIDDGLVAGAGWFGVWIRGVLGSALFFGLENAGFGLRL